MGQPKETAGSILAAMFEAEESGASLSELKTLEGKLHRQITEELSEPNTQVTVVVSKNPLPDF